MPVIPKEFTTEESPISVKPFNRRVRLRRIKPIISVKPLNRGIVKPTISVKPLNR